MKIILSHIFLLAYLSGFAQGIVFQEGSFNDVLAKAKKENKPVFVDCYTTWCGPCKWLSANVFTNKAVGDYYNKNFVSFKLDMEKGEGKDFRTKYQIAAYPTLMFLNPDGEVRHRAVGAMDTTAFIRLGETALDTTRNFGTYLTKYKNGNREPAFLADFARQAYNANYAFNIDEYFSTQTEEQLLSELNFELIEIYNPPVNSREFKNLILKREQYYKTVGQHRTDNKVKFILSRHVQLYEKSIDQKNIQPFLLPVISQLGVADSVQLSYKVEMDYNQNRTRNWERYFEILNILFQKYGENALSETEWVQVCENLILYNSDKAGMIDDVKKYVVFARETSSLKYKYALIEAWLLAKENKPNDEWIKKAKKWASEAKVSDQQFERMKKSYFPE
jgi:thiol-disulfide isomerase/thioredoxin